jgi:hypothetical protein
MEFNCAYGRSSSIGRKKAILEKQIVTIHAFGISNWELKGYWIAHTLQCMLFHSFVLPHWIHFLCASYRKWRKISPQTTKPKLLTSNQITSIGFRIFFDPWKIILLSRNNSHSIRTQKRRFPHSMCSIANENFQYAHQCLLLSGKIWRFTQSNQFTRTSKYIPPTRTATFNDDALPWVFYAHQVNNKWKFTCIENDFLSEFISCKPTLYSKIICSINTWRKFQSCLWMKNIVKKKILIVFLLLGQKIDI